MGTKYATVSVSGYNSSPPADNGSTDATNQILWSTIKTKLPDPLKTAIEAVNSALVTYTDTSVRSVTASDSTVAGDHLRTVQTASSVTAVVTISLMDATTAAAGYMVRVHNGGQANLTVGRATGTDTINGALKNVTLGLGQSALFVVNSTTNGYLMASGNAPITDSTDPSKQLKFDTSGITTGTVRTLIVPDSSDTLVLLAATQELTNKTLNASVGKGTWTASGTWTLPALTLGGTVSGGGNQINNVVIGTSTPLAVTGTVITGNSFIPNSSSIPTNGLYLTAGNTPSIAANSTLVQSWTSTGASITGTLGVSDIVTVTKSSGDGIRLYTASSNASTIQIGQDATSAYIQASITGSGTQLPIYTYIGGSIAEQISTARAFRWNAYGAGALTTDGSGNITAVSDERDKRDIRPFSRGIESLLAINPILHGYNESSGLDQSRSDYAGFSAQNVMQVIPEAVSVAPNGRLTFADRPVLAASINALKDHESRLRALEARLQ